MTKRKPSLNLKKQQESLPKVSPPLQKESAPVLSPAVITSEKASTDFDRAIHDSRMAIASQEEEKAGKRGRKKLPRDASGNIIREQVTPAPLPPVSVNPQSVEQNKPIIRTGLSAISSILEKRLGSEEARCNQDEESILVECGAVLLEKYLPDAMSKYGMEASCAFAVITWSLRCYKIGNIKKQEEKETQKKTALKDGKIPSDEIRPN